MNTTTTTPAESSMYQSPAYWAALTLQTRRYGHTYVHSAARATVSSWDGATIDGIYYSYTGWGKSLQSTRGHKYKVHARRDGKPVPTAELKTLTAAK